MGFWSNYWGWPIQGGKKELIYISYWVYTKPFICTAPHIKVVAGQRVEFVTTKYKYVPNLGVIFDAYILSNSPKLAGTDPVIAVDSCYGTQNEQKNTQNNFIEV